MSTESDQNRTVWRPAAIGSVGTRVVFWLQSWGPALLLMALIFVLSSQPELGKGGWFTALAYKVFGGSAFLPHLLPYLAWLDRYSSWIAHFVEYALLAMAYIWAVRRLWPMLRSPNWVAFAMASVYALSDEWHQSFVPGRHADLRDLLTDWVAAAVALFFIRRFSAHR